jgi:formate dehydrogenase major subunit
MALHPRTQTGRCEGRNELLGEETADISISDANDLNISDREIILVSSRRGEVRERARVNPCASGLVVPFIRKI